MQDESTNITHSGSEYRRSLGVAHDAIPSRNDPGNRQECVATSKLPVVQSLPASLNGGAVHGKEYSVPGSFEGGVLLLAVRENANAFANEAVHSILSNTFAETGYACSRLPGDNSADYHHAKDTRFFFSRVVQRAATI